MAAQKSVYTVGDKRLSVSNLDKVLYPSTGTTKADVMRYYLEVAEVMIPQIARRPVTRKRWPEGVEGQSFFRKDLEDSAPEWIATGEIRHKTSVNHYPLVDQPATLAWFAQVAALELHTPQWRFNPSNPSSPSSTTKRETPTVSCSTSTPAPASHSRRPPRSHLSLIHI